MLNPNVKINPNHATLSIISFIEHATEKVRAKVCLKELKGHHFAADQTGPDQWVIIFPRNFEETFLKCVKNGKYVSFATLGLYALGGGAHANALIFVYRKGTIEIEDTVCFLTH
jgi:hypothetical protein